jgi:hypothetical protein
MDETEIRRALAPYMLDGTEAIPAIDTLLRSPHRPPDHELSKAIGKILRRVYADRVTIDAVVNFVIETDAPAVEPDCAPLRARKVST